MTERPLKRSWRRIVGVTALTVVAVAAIWHHIVTRPTPFDAGIWRTGENVHWRDEAPRLRMADGLVERRALLGKTRAEIVEMLGAPTETAKFSSYGLVYWLGLERGFMSIDSEWLVVGFDANGRAAEAMIVRD